MILTERFDKALLFASELHRNQKRKNSTAPYVCHLLAVAALVIENIESICADQDAAEDYVIIAVLHDAVEDQGGMPTYERIKQQFGAKIADGVLLLSHSAPDETTERASKAVRNEIYLNNIRAASREIALVSCCDKIHNLRTMYADSLSMGQKFWAVFSQSPHDTMDNYEKLGKVYAEKLPNHRIIAIYNEVVAAVEKALPEV